MKYVENTKIEMITAVPFGILKQRPAPRWTTNRMPPFCLQRFIHPIATPPTLFYFFLSSHLSGAINGNCSEVKWIGKSHSSAVLYRQDRGRRTWICTLKTAASRTYTNLYNWQLHVLFRVLYQPGSAWIFACAVSLSICPLLVFLYLLLCTNAHTL